jgi:hypothetical protein
MAASTSRLSSGRKVAAAMSMRGAAIGDMLRAEALEGKTCILPISRTKRGVRVQPENCESFHGPSCDFEGNYRKRR